MPLVFRSPVRKHMLTHIELGEREEGWQHIDAGDHTTSGSHGGIAKVVVRCEGYSHDDPVGVELANRITRIPAMLAALRAIVDVESLYDAQYQAREALRGIGGADVDKR
jgi:hypothetical protein